MKNIDENDKPSNIRTTRLLISQARNQGIYSLFRSMTRSSKNLRNITLYAQRRHYDILKFQIKNIVENPEAFYKELTLRDFNLVLPRISNYEHLITMLLPVSKDQLLGIQRKNHNLKEECYQALSTIITFKEIIYDAASAGKTRLKKMKIKNVFPKRISVGSRDILYKSKSKNMSIIEFYNYYCNLKKASDLDPKLFDNDKYVGVKDFLNKMIPVFEYTISKIGIRTYTDKQSEKTESKCVTDIICPFILYENLTDNYAKINHKEVYRSLPSQAAQQVCQKDVTNSYTSFFGKKIKDSKANPPTYSSKNGFYKVVWKENSIKYEDDYLYLSLGNSWFDNLEKSVTINFPINGRHSLKFNKKKKTFSSNGKKLKFSTQRSNENGIEEQSLKQLKIKIGSWVRDNSNKIKIVQLVPIDDHGDNFELLISYEINIPTIKEEEQMERFMAVDLGVVNLATMVTNIDSLRPWIVSGKEVVRVNKKYCNLIEKETSRLEKERKVKTSHYTRDLWNRRRRIIKNMFEIYASRIVDYCKMHKVDKLILGYNKNWKQSSNLGKKNNKNFQFIPFKLFIDAIFDRGRKYGICIVENEESYTSKCDSLINETFDACRERCILGENRRIKRGLYFSSKGVYINADVNGALNIMRKHLDKVHTKIISALNEFISIKYVQFLNPLKINSKDLLRCKLENIEKCAGSAMHSYNLGNSQSALHRRQMVKTGAMSVPFRNQGL